MLSPIEEIKNRLDIVEVIGNYVRLKKTGSNFSALCPFHSEKKPSFFVSPRLQIFKCFGCGVGGDIFKFIMLIEGIEFKEALKILAEKAGIELKPISPQEKTERQKLWEILELACRFFEKQMEGTVGQKVKEYLLKRKINEESIKKWRLGWAPDTKSSLFEFLKAKGFKNEEIQKAGLVFKKENGEIIDFFRGRIIFPIFDLNSQVIGFSGRVFLQKDEPKYINSPNTLLYDKSRILYGLDRGKIEIKSKGKCLIMEGYTDVILAHQEGYKNSVCVGGTSLTHYQLKILKRYTDTLVLSFDMDVAGDFATKRGIDLARLEGFEIKVLILPPEKDPADILGENPKEFEKYLNSALSIMDYYFENALSKFDPNTLEGKKEICKILLPEIKKIPNEVEKAFWLSKLAEKIKVREEDLRKELLKLKIEEEMLGLEEEERAVQLRKPKTRKELLEENFLLLLFLNPQLSNEIEKEAVEFFEKPKREIIEKLKENPNLKPENLSPEAQELYFEIALEAEIKKEEQKDISEIKKEFDFCLKEISVISIKEELAKISEELKNQKEEKELILRFQYLTKRLQEIQKNEKKEK